MYYPKVVFFPIELAHKYVVVVNFDNMKLHSPTLWCTSSNSIYYIVMGDGFGGLSFYLFRIKAHIEIRATMWRFFLVQLDFGSGNLEVLSALW